METTYEIISFETKADFKNKISDHREGGYDKKTALKFAKNWIDDEESAVVVIVSSDGKFTKTLTN